MQDVKNELYEKLKKLNLDAQNHHLYSALNTVSNIRVFMEHHVYAVWDFMSLLKALQIHCTSLSIPWVPSIYPSYIVRLINEIVLGEESDIDQNGKPSSHFELYLDAMKEVGASTDAIRNFIKQQDINLIPVTVRKFVSANLEIAKSKNILSIASTFFYGREKIIPEMFTPMVSAIEKNNIYSPTLKYYLERHMDIDANDHGPKANKFLSYIVNDDPVKEFQSLEYGVVALENRIKLWDNILNLL